MPRPGRLAEWLGVSAPTVTVSLQRLARDGLIRIADDRSVELTDAGAEAAATIVRRHRIVERWMTDVLGLDWATADLEAAHAHPRHVATSCSTASTSSSAGRSTCPHGNVIPGRTPPERAARLVRLVDLADGEQRAGGPHLGGGRARGAAAAPHPRPARASSPGSRSAWWSRSAAGWTLQAGGAASSTVDPSTARGRLGRVTRGPLG